MEWIPVRIPEAIYKEITDFINRNKFWINEHEFIRDAVREKLERVKTDEQPLMEVPS